MIDRLSRRHFFHSVAGAFAVSRFASAKADVQPQPVPLKTRWSINGKNAKADLDAYAVSVAAMKKLPDSDPRSWVADQYMAPIRLELLVAGCTWG